MPPTLAADPAPPRPSREPVALTERILVARPGRILVPRPGRILVIGAGFAGAVYARTLAEHGHQVHVIDRRPHLAGNAFDEPSATGVRVHRYGPHLFHTSMPHVVRWVQRFGEFVPYEHRVSALLPGLAGAAARFAPLPVNRTTVSLVFDVPLASEAAMQDFLTAQAVPCAAPRNAAEHLYSRIGTTLTDLFFRPYTRKMWALDLEDVDAAIVNRIPLRLDDEDRYFPTDTFQIMPREGYTALFANILDHDRITLSLATPFTHDLACDYAHCFNSMAIDEYYDEEFGPLPYRSIRFHHREEPAGYAFGQTSVVNFTDDRAHTRQTDWSRLPHHAGAGPRKTITLEQPCDYRDNALERYYPVKTSDGRNDATYRRYAARAAGEPRMTFIGRCGTYQYLDMHQVINQSLKGALDWVKAAT